jgi:predicted site-specific integrase-resolvase
MLNEIKDFGIGITLAEAEQLIGYSRGTLKAYVNTGKIIPKEYLRRSGATWIVSINWIEQKLNSK